MNSAKKLRANPSAEAYCKIATPSTIVGSTSGDKKSALKTWLKGKRLRAKTRAAGTPKMSAVAVAATASSPETTNASTKVGSLTTCQYQRSVSPCGGNRRYSVAVNDMAITTNSGSAKYSIAIALAAAMKIRPRRSARSACIGSPSWPQASFEQNEITPDQEQRHREQDDRQGGADVGAERCRVLLKDQDRRHHLAPSAENTGDHVGADTQGEDDDRAGDHTGKAQGKGHGNEGSRWSSAQIARRLDERTIDGLQHTANGKRHDGQQNVGEPNDDAELTIEDVERGIDQSNREQARIDDPSPAQDHDPAERAHDVACEKWRHQQHIDEPPSPWPTHVEDDEVGERIAEQKCNHRHPQRDQQRVDERVPIIGIAQHGYVVAERHATFGTHEAFRDQQPKRRKKKQPKERDRSQHQKCRVGRCEPHLFPALRRASARQSSSRRAASLCQCTQTGAPGASSSTSRPQPGSAAISCPSARTR